MKFSRMRRVLTIGAAGLVLSAGALVANGQSRDYQRAQREVQRQCAEYQYRPTRDNYRDCLEAQRRLQSEYAQYQRSGSRVIYNNNGYYNNGYSNTGRMYRVYRNGSYYETDNRGAELLRQAVNSGYRQGYVQGQNDRRYGRGGNYYGNSIYSNGMYGYQSYVARDQYQYYFQQGFQRGYEDGYSSTSRYGYRSGNSYNILGSVLSTILNLSQR